MIYAPKSIPEGCTRDQYFYVADLLPTLGTLSNAKFKCSGKIEGIDQSKMLKTNSVGQRKDVVTFDDLLGYSSYIYNSYKIVNGSFPAGANEGFLGTNDNSNYNQIEYLSSVLSSKAAIALNLRPTFINLIRSSAKIRCGNLKTKTPCSLQNGPCLFDIINDPCEENNIANERADILRKMQDMFEKKISDRVPPRLQPTDYNSDPMFFDYTWNWWQNDS
jgi:arylsulfatase B